MPEPQVIVDLDTLKGELRLVGSEEDTVLQRKLDEAHALCLDYVNQRRGDEASEEWSETVTGWTDETAPPQVIAAVLEMAVALYRFRGDDDRVPKWLEEGLLPSGVRMKLDRLRDPAIA